MAKTNSNSTNQGPIEKGNNIGKSTEVKKDIYKGGHHSTNPPPKPKPKN